MTLLLVGGNGGLTAAYRVEAARAGLELVHAEKRLPVRVAHLAAVLLSGAVVSRQLATDARALAAAERVRLVYLARPSIAALRRALEELRPAAAEARP